mgnify:CR=1 FL=1
MSYINLLKVALRAILSNKFRSFLSMLGIIIGVAAVIIMMAIGQGSKENVKAELSKMGTNLLTIRPGAERRFAGARPDPASMQTLKDEDVEAIRREATLITYVSPEVSASGQVIYGNKNTTATLYGESPDYLEIKKWELAEGDCFTEEDCIKNAKVCLVGTTVVEQLFGDKNYNCIGKNIRFKNIPFRIVGILKSKGYNNWGMDQDNLLIAPNTTVMKRVAAQTWYSSIAVSALSEETSEAAIEEFEGVLLFVSHDRYFIDQVADRVIEIAAKKTLSPMIRGKRLKIYYGLQVSTNPQTIRLFVNDPKLVTPAYKSYIEKAIRARFGLEGAPLRIFMKARSRKSVSEFRNDFKES